MFFSINFSSFIEMLDKYKLHIFKMNNEMIWYMFILGNDYYNQVNI